MSTAEVLVRKAYALNQEASNGKERPLPLDCVELSEKPWRRKGTAQVSGDWPTPALPPGGPPPWRRNRAVRDEQLFRTAATPSSPSRLMEQTASPPWPRLVDNRGLTPWSARDHDCKRVQPRALAPTCLEPGSRERSPNRSPPQTARSAQPVTPHTERNFSSGGSGRASKWSDSGTTSDAATMLRPCSVPLGHLKEGQGMLTSEGSLRPTTAESEPPVAIKSRLAEAEPQLAVAPAGAGADANTRRLSLLQEFTRFRAEWDPQLWCRAREELVKTGSWRELHLLWHHVHQSTAQALEEQSYHVSKNRKAVSIPDTRVSSEWFGEDCVGEIPDLPGEMGLAPPLLVTDLAPLDILTRLRSLYGEHHQITLVAELNEFDAQGATDFTRPAPVSPACLPLRTDFARYVGKTETSLRGSAATMQSHLSARRDPYVFCCSDLTVFRGSREEGYPFLPEPIRADVIVTSMADARPSVQTQKSSMYRDPGSKGTEWYTQESDHFAMIHRLKLIGLVALEQAARRDDSVEHPENTADHQEEERPILILGTLGCGGGRAGHHPRHSFAQALKEWRQLFSPFFHSIFVCCGGDDRKGHKLAHLLDRVVNANIYKGMPKVMPWHWIAEEVELSIRPEKLEAVFTANEKCQGGGENFEARRASVTQDTALATRLGGHPGKVKKALTAASLKLDSPKKEKALQLMQAALDAPQSSSPMSNSALPTSPKETDASPMASEADRYGIVASETARSSRSDSEASSDADESPGAAVSAALMLPEKGGLSFGGAEMHSFLESARSSIAPSARGSVVDDLPAPNFGKFRQRQASMPCIDDRRMSLYEASGDPTSDTSESSQGQPLGSARRPSNATSVNSYSRRASNTVSEYSRRASNAGSEVSGERRISYFDKRAMGMDERRQSLQSLAGVPGLGNRRPSVQSQVATRRESRRESMVAGFDGFSRPALMAADTISLSADSISDLLSMANSRFEENRSEHEDDIDHFGEESHHDDGDKKDPNLLAKNREIFGGVHLEDAECVRRRSIEKMVETYNDTKLEIVRRHSTVHYYLGDCVNIVEDMSGSTLARKQSVAAESLAGLLADKAAAKQAHHHHHHKHGHKPGHHQTKEKSEQEMKEKHLRHSHLKHQDQEDHLHSMRHSLREKIVTRRESLLAHGQGPGCMQFHTHGPASKLSMTTQFAGARHDSVKSDREMEEEFDEEALECRNVATDNSKKGKCDEFGWNDTRSFVF